MTTGVFFRRLATAMIITGIAVVTTLFGLFSIPTLKPWANWEAVHSKLAEVSIVVAPQEVAAIRVSWWTLFVLSLIFIFLLLVIGEETRDSYRWLVAQSTKSHKHLQELWAKLRMKSKSQLSSMRLVKLKR